MLKGGDDFNRALSILTLVTVELTGLTLLGVYGGGALASALGWGKWANLLFALIGFSLGLWPIVRRYLKTEEQRRKKNGSQ